MKLAFCLFKYFPYGGLERDFLQIANACHARGHDITVYTMAWQGERPALKLMLLPQSGLSNHQQGRSFAHAISKELQAHHFDQVIGFNRIPHLDFYYAADVCFANRHHSLWSRLNPRARHFLALEESVFKPLAKTKIFVLTPQNQRDYQRCYQTPDERFIVLPPNVARLNLTFAEYQKLHHQHRRQLNISEGDFLLVQVGSYFKTKGVDRSLQALAKIAPELREKIKFFIIGDGDIKSYQRLANQLGLKDPIQFLGKKDNVKDYLLAADLLLHPARVEAAGKVLLEAITCGLPSIVTEHCGYAHHIKEAGAGKLIESNATPTQISNAITELLRHDLSGYRDNALTYARKVDLYSLVDRFIEAIEQ